ncbi:hypothetical protein [Roseovarius aestuarii]|nr:hypothetical protein [Roseovarius aestuarii]
MTTPPRDPQARRFDGPAIKGHDKAEIRQKHGKAMSVKRQNRVIA